MYVCRILSEEKRITAMSLNELIEQRLWKTFNFRGRTLSHVSTPPIPLQKGVCVHTTLKLACIYMHRCFSMHLLGRFWGMPPPIHQGKLDAVGSLLRPFWSKVELQSLVLPAVLCMCDSAYSGLLDIHMHTDCLAEMLVPSNFLSFKST